MALVGKIPLDYYIFHVEKRCLQKKFLNLNFRYVDHIFILAEGKEESDGLKAPFEKKNMSLTLLIILVKKTPKKNNSHS